MSDAMSAIAKFGRGPLSKPQRFVTPGTHCTASQFAVAVKEREQAQSKQ
jgi:hypothetical protein